VSEHVDTETLAAFREDLLAGSEAAGVAAHLASCARCATVDAQLAQVSALLASAPAPPIPATLTARIQAALAAERAAQHGLAPVSPQPGTVPAAPQPGTVPAAGHQETIPADARARRAPRPGRFPRLALRVSSVAAAIAVLAAGGYGLTRLAAGGGEAGTSSSAAGAAARPPVSRKLESGALPRPLPAASNLPLVASGTNYQPGQIAAQADAVLRGLIQRTSGAEGANSSHASAFGGLSEVRACVNRVTGGRAPKVVDVASYRGEPALAIMVSAGGGPVRVWIVGARCSATTSDVLAEQTIPGGA
jgi:hypothetical protein